MAGTRKTKQRSLKTRKTQHRSKTTRARKNKGRSAKKMRGGAFSMANLEKAQVRKLSAGSTPAPVNTVDEVKVAFKPSKSSFALGDRPSYLRYEGWVQTKLAPTLQKTIGALGLPSSRTQMNSGATEFGFRVKRRSNVTATSASLASVPVNSPSGEKTTVGSLGSVNISKY